MSPKTTIDKTKSAIVDKVDAGTHTIMEIAGILPTKRPKIGLK